MNGLTFEGCDIIMLLYCCDKVYTGQNPITEGDLEWILTKLLFTVTILSFDIPSPNVYNMTVNKINLHFAGKFSIDHNRIPGRKYETITIFLMQRQVNRMDSCDSHGRSSNTGWKRIIVCDFITGHILF